MSERRQTASLVDKVVARLAATFEAARVLNVPAARALFADATGLLLSDQDGTDLSELAELLKEDLDRLDEHGASTDVLKLSFDVGQFLHRISQLPSSKPTGSAANHAIGYFLTQGWGDRPLVTALLNLLGVLEYETLDSNDDLAGEVAAFYPKRLVSLLSDPDGWADEVYQWKTDFNFDQFAVRLLEVARAAGCDASLVSTGDDHSDDGDFNGGLRIPLVRHGFTDDDRSELGLLVSQSPGFGPWKAGIEFTAYAVGTLPPMLFETASTCIEIEAKRDLSGGISVTVAHGGPIRASFGSLSDEEVTAGTLIVRVRRDATDQINWITIDSLHIRSRNEVFELGISFEPTSEDIYAELRAEVEGAFTPSDGFLGSILPGNTTINVPLVVRWSAREGLSLSGFPGLRAVIGIPSIPGPISIPEAELSFGPGSQGNIELSLAPTILANIGPIAATIQGGGLILRIAPMALVEPKDEKFDVLSVALEPPTGVGLAIDARVVTGGGYLYSDREKEQYAGALQLEIAEKISVSAVGLLSTRMPDGSKGFSLLVIISARFEPGIQLGYGFTLNGLGGLLGFNHTVSVDVLREGLRQGALSSILFPQNVVENAPQIMSNLSTIFPPAHDRFLFGPMAIISWGGSPPIVTLEIGIILELPEPVRLMMLGRLRVVLPPTKGDSAGVEDDQNRPRIKLQLDALGVFDFESGDVSLDAVLYDSVIGPFPVTGQMALRANFGPRPMFLLSVGGVHPAFQAPAGFPSLEPVTFTLAKQAKGLDVRLQMAAYFALTSNTVQFGSRLDLSAHLGIFELAGQLGFDALIQFNPFGLIASFQSAVVVKAKGFVLMGVNLQMNVTGPSPWHAWGKAEFRYLIKSVTKEFDVQIGQTEPPPLPPPINVIDELERELQDLNNWSSQLPKGESPLVTFRRESDPTLLVHPFAELQVSQRCVPLVGIDQPITLFGNTTPEGDTAFTLTATVDSGVDAQSLSLEDVMEWFAPAQFYQMSDVEKLTAPSFEQMKAGIRFKIQGGYKCGTAVHREIDAARSAATKSMPRTVSVDLLNRVASFGAAGKASIRTTGPAKYRSPSRPKQGVTLQPAGYRVVTKEGGLSGVGASAVAAVSEAFRSYSAARAQVDSARSSKRHARSWIVPDIGKGKDSP